MTAIIRNSVGQHRETVGTVVGETIEAVAPKGESVRDEIVTIDPVVELARAYVTQLAEHAELAAKRGQIWESLPADVQVGPRLQVAWYREQPDGEREPIYARSIGELYNYAIGIERGSDRNTEMRRELANKIKTYRNLSRNQEIQFATSGLDAVEAKIDASDTKLIEIKSRILDTPARTIEGVVVKLAILQHEAEETDEDRFTTTAIQKSKADLIAIMEKNKGYCLQGTGKHGCTAYTARLLGALARPQPSEDFAK